MSRVARPDNLVTNGKQLPEWSADRLGFAVDHARSPKPPRGQSEKPASVSEVAVFDRPRRARK